MDYETIPYPRMRRLTSDVGYLTRNKYLMRGLVEIDVTTPRKMIRAYQAKTGEKISFTAFLAACIGQAVMAHRQVHAYRNWRGQLVLFADTDIGMLIEIDTTEGKIPMGYVIRAAHQKTPLQIHHEIRMTQHHHSATPELKQLTRLTALPAPLRRLIMWVIYRNPHWMKRIQGTVALTAVGMFAKRSGWGIGMPLHTLAITVGGISEKPGIVNGHIEPREYLNLTLDFDHLMVDGAPAARFTDCLANLIESGCGLPGGFDD